MELIESNKLVEAYNWPSLENGTVLTNETLNTTLVKVDDNHGYCDGYANNPMMVDIEKYIASNGDEYYYFSITDEDWNPILPKYLKILS